MIFTADNRVPALSDPTSVLLQELGLSIHRLGYKYLTVAIPRYAQDDQQSLSKELYPYVGRCFHFAHWRSVERSIRGVITDAWDHRDPEVWARYFPRQEKAPTNKQFLAVLAQHLR